MAINDLHIYWANATGMISRADLDGSTVVENLITTTGEPNGVAVGPA